MEQKDIISIFPEQGTHNKTTLVLKKPKTMSSSIDNLNGCRNIPNKEHMLAYPHKKLESLRTCDDHVRCSPVDKSRISHLLSLFFKTRAATVVTTASAAGTIKHAITDLLLSCFCFRLNSFLIIAYLSSTFDCYFDCHQ